MTSLPTAVVRARLDAVSVAGLDVPTFIAEALDLLVRAVPFTAACAATTDPDTQLVTRALKWGTMAGVTLGEDEQWAMHEYVVNDLYDYRDLQRRPGGVLTTHSESGGDPRRSPRFEAFFAPRWDVTDELRSAATADGQLWGFLALFRDDSTRRSTFSAAEMEFFAGTSSTVARGIRAGLVVGAASATSSGADTSAPAVLVVGAGGLLTSANAAAQQRVSALGGGVLGEDALPLAVQSVVNVARRFGQGLQDHPPRLRVRGTDGRWSVVSGSPMQSFGAATGAQVAVTIEDAGTPDVLPLVVASFGLTAREQDVVRLVLSGVATAQISAALHVSAYTVQDHLKAVFEKVGVRSRRELTAKVFLEEYAPRIAEQQPVGPSGRFR